MQVMTGPLAQEAGVTYLTEGTHNFTLSNGAKFTKYTSPYQPKYGDFAFPYDRNQDRFNLPHQVAEGITSIATNPVPDFPTVDIMMTHGPPSGILDEGLAWDEERKEKVPKNLGCDDLLRAVGRARPLLYCFGHIHDGYGAETVSWKAGSETGVSIMDGEVEDGNTFPQPDKQVLEFGKQTLMVNAAIKDNTDQAINAPWMIQLDLPGGDRGGEKKEDL